MESARIQDRKKKNWQTLSDHRYQVLIPGVFFSGQIDSEATMIKIICVT